MVICGADQELVIGKPLDDADEEQNIAVWDNVEVEEIFLCEKAGFGAVLPDFVVEGIFEDLQLDRIVPRPVARHGSGLRDGAIVRSASAQLCWLKQSIRARKVLKTRLGDMSTKVWVDVGARMSRVVMTELPGASLDFDCPAWNFGKSCPSMTALQRRALFHWLT
jgi:hypothetical protein